MSSAVLRPLLDRGKNLRLLLGAHAFEALELSSFRCGSEVVDALDVERGVEHRDRLRTHALKAQQIEDRWRELLEQLLVVTARAGLSQLADARGEVLADAWDRAQLLFIELRDGMGPRSQRLRRLRRPSLLKPERSSVS